MEVSSIATLATAMSQVKTATDLNTTALKRGVYMQNENVLTLLQALPQTANPAHLGQTIDLFG
ncbi:MAG: YjfB family protein [Betaproteobacteria bacterium]|nr:YjfB family protein [Betaproteobacteria bacterium]